jgi:flagellar secretion chaperone FliS
MAAAYSTQAYQNTEVGTSDPNHQVVLLFDAAVRFIHRAKAGMESGDHYAQCEAVLRTQKILSTLMAALDTKASPELGESLFVLYNWLYANLTEASVHDNVELLGEVLVIVTNLRDAWRQAEQNLRMGETEAAPEQARAA